MAVMSFVSIEAFAQEVRGVETKTITNTDSDGAEYSSFAFTNMNSITVCVDAELNRHTEKRDPWNQYKITENKGVVDRKSFTLRPGETYVWRKFYDYSISDYYVTYKAFKLQ